MGEHNISVTGEGTPQHPDPKGCNRMASYLEMRSKDMEPAKVRMIFLWKAM